MLNKGKNMPDCYWTPKFWQRVEDQLRNIEETGAYFVGGTLSLPLGKEKGICLNLDGIGFLLHGDLKNPVVYQPDYITSMVCEIYRKVKGETEYFTETVGTSGVPETVRG